MYKIYLDIDNNTPGAIIGPILKYIIPDCSMNNRADVLNLSLIDKYFKKNVVLIRCPKSGFGNFCNQLVCKKHSLKDYTNLKFINDKILYAKSQHRYTGSNQWIHFSSKEQADIAKKYVAEYFCILGRCCYGKGIQIR